MMNGAARGATLACAAFAMVAAFASAGGAQTIRPTPTPVACARPNTPASVIRAAPTDTPPLGQQQGLQGIVRMIVSLDADSRVAGVRLLNSPNAIINHAALAAARQSTFQTEIRNCRPVAADYVYSTYVGEGDGAFTVVADGTAARAPDVAYVQASILTHGDAAENAIAKGDAALDALKAKLGALGIGTGKIRWWQIPPRIPDDRAAARHVEITVDTVANAGHVAAAAASVKSVEALGVRYALNDSAAAFRDALNNALKDAEKTAREALALQHLQLGALQHVAVPPYDPMRQPTPLTPVRLVPLAGGFKEPDIRIPDVEVRATVTVTYEIKR